MTRVEEARRHLAAAVELWAGGTPNEREAIAAAIAELYEPRASLTERAQKELEAFTDA